MDLQENAHIKITSHSVRQYDIYLHGAIDFEDERNIEIVQVLRGASEDSVINIYINSYGGSLHATAQLLNAIEGCQGHVRTIVECMAYSAASLIFLSGDERITMPHAQLMVHNFATAYEGDPQNINRQLHSDIELFKSLSNKYYKDFLTKKELKSVQETTEEIYLNAKGIQKRLEKQDND